MPRRSTRHLVGAVLLALFVLPIASLALAAWPTTPSGVPVSQIPPRVDGPPKAVPDSCGGMICAWLDTIPGSSSIDVQRLDYAGQPRWMLNGFPVSPIESGPIAFDIAPDTLGGAFVAFTDHRISGDTTDVYIQHVLASGTIDPAWPAGGLPVCALPAIQDQPRVIADGHGGALIAWLDSRGNVDFAPDIYAQRVDVTGAVLWTVNGVQVVSQPRYQGPPMDLAADGVGGLYIAWSDDRVSAAQQDIYAQHLDRTSGARTWAVAGLGVCTATGIQQDVHMTASLGNLILVWIDGRAGGGQEDVYAQGVTIGGAPMWAPNGVPINLPTAPQNDSPAIVFDELGGAVVGWVSGPVSPNPILRAQRLDANGSALWAPGGVVVCSFPSGHLDVHAITDQRGGAVFAWRDGHGGWHIWAERVDPSGASLWTPDGVELSNPSLQHASDFPVLVPDAAAGAVVAWRDYASDSGFGIFAQQIGAGGSLGVRASSKNCAPDVCGHAYTDFGDAPENLPAYPSGRPGHFPTCISNSTPGTQEIACGPALSTPPGTTGFVEHVASWDDTVFFGFGCNHAKIPGLAVDAELDGSMAFGLPGSFPGASACSPSVAVNEYEKVFGGMWFGADESAGDLYDSGLTGPAPDLLTCANPGFPFTAWLCASTAKAVYLNLLIDWSQDGDWNDVVSCPSDAVCAPEWAVKNWPMTLQPGCNSVSTPTFLGGPNTGPTWMRMTLTATPVGNDFPWAGSVIGGNPGVFHGGETEDYPLMIVSRPTGVADRIDSGSLRLEPPAPNPSPGAMDFHFTLPRQGRAELAVYDLVGRRVRTLIDAATEAGVHAAHWDGRGRDGVPVAAGVYYARLRIEGQLRSQCVVVTR
jgi:hypothetical protein